MGIFPVPTEDGKIESILARRAPKPQGLWRPWLVWSLEIRLRLTSTRLITALPVQIVRSHPLVIAGILAIMSGLGGNVYVVILSLRLSRFDGCLGLSFHPDESNQRS